VTIILLGWAGFNLLLSCLVTAYVGALFLEISPRVPNDVDKVVTVRQTIPSNENAPAHGKNMPGAGTVNTHFKGETSPIDIIPDVVSGSAFDAF